MSDQIASWVIGAGAIGFLAGSVTTSLMHCLATRNPYREQSPRRQRRAGREIERLSRQIEDQIKETH